MKIVLVTSLYPPEIDRRAAYVKELAERLSASHTVTLIAYASTSEPVPGVRLITISKRRWLPVRLMKCLFTLFAQARGADVLLVEHSVAALLPAIVMRAFTRIPVVVNYSVGEAWERATQAKCTSRSFEDYLAHPEGTAWIRSIGWLERILLKRADRILVPLLALCDMLTQAYQLPREQVVLLAPPADRALILPVGGSRAPHRLMVSTPLLPWKGIGTLLEAVSELSHAVPDLELVIAGDGPERPTLERVTREHSLTERVTFVGHVSHAETAHLRHTCGIHVVPTTRDELPFSILKSFEAGIPVVMSRLASSRETSREGTLALLFEPGDAHDLARAVSELLTQPDLRSRLSEQAHEEVHHRYSWPHHLHSLVAYLELPCAS